MNNGELTAQLARILSQRFQERAHVLFDHGDKMTDGADKVGVIRSWYGNILTRDSLLSDLDIAVVVPNSNKVIALVEIEESSANPKTLLGDVFAILLGDHITFQGKRELYVDSNSTLTVLAFSKSHVKISDHLSGQLQAHRGWNTRNSCVGRIVVGTYKDFAELEDKLTIIIEQALGSRQSKI